MLSLTQFSFAFNAPAALAPSRANVKMTTGADLEALAKDLNPKIGMWDPLDIVGLAKRSGNEELMLNWFRQAEVKHGRVAMAAFVGFCVQENGIHWPWALSGGAFGGPEVTFAEISAAGGPAAQWDALPTAAKVQIFVFIGLLEMVSEASPVLEKQGQKHYVYGGKTGFFPSLKAIDELPHPVPLDFWDPFGFTSKMSEERKAKGRLAEINNGRLAMIGIFGLISASKGLNVPGLDTIEGIERYDGEYMAAFSTANIDLPGVQYMLDASANWNFAIPGLTGN